MRRLGNLLPTTHRSGLSRDQVPGEGFMKTVGNKLPTLRPVAFSIMPFNTNSGYSRWFEIVPA